MELPSNLNRSAIKRAFHRVSDKTWDYLFDHEKENGLVECRTGEATGKVLWYSTARLKRWLVSKCYYFPEDFEAQPARKAGPWSALLTS